MVDKQIDEPHSDNIHTPTKRRKLSASEKALFPTDFCNKIKISNVILISRAHNPFASGKILTRNDDIYWPNCPVNFTKESISIQALLMHELCHVWQYHTGRLSAIGYITSPSRWKYRYSFKPEKKFDDYPTEKQADLLQDWYLVNKGYQASNYAGKAVQPTKNQINKVVPFKW